MYRDHLSKKISIIYRQYGQKVEFDMNYIRLDCQTFFKRSTEMRTFTFFPLIRVKATQKIHDS